MTRRWLSPGIVACLSLIDCGGAPPTAVGAVAAVTPTPLGAAATCAAWAASQRGTGVPPAIGAVIAQRQALFDAGGGIKAVGSKYFAAQFPQGFASATRRRVLVSLHGTGGAPETEWSVDWRAALSGRGWGFLGLKYVDDSTGEHDDDAVIYSNIKALLADVRSNCDFGSSPQVFLAGFSRGSAQAFPVVYRDRLDAKVFAAAANNSGAWIIGGPLPPTLAGVQARRETSAFSGGRFWMYCGERDFEHGYPMCDEMEAARSFVLAYGGVVQTLFRDPTGGHGGLTKNPDALGQMMAYFEGLP